MAAVLGAEDFEPCSTRRWPRDGGGSAKTQREKGDTVVSEASREGACPAKADRPAAAPPASVPLPPLACEWEWWR